MPATLFLSHRHRDKAVADTMEAELEALCPDLSIIRFEEAPTGEDYRQWVIEQLNQSDGLILLYTDPDDTWSWPMFEVGYFMSRRPPCGGNSHVACFCDQFPPDPLRPFEAVRWTEEHRLERFLRGLLSGNWLTGLTTRSDVSEETVRATAERIKFAFETCRPVNTTPKYYPEKFIVRFQRPSPIPSEGIPDEAQIECSNDGLPSLNIERRNFTWKELSSYASKARPKGTNWLVELDRAIRKVSKGHPPPMMTSTFRGVGQGRSSAPHFIGSIGMNNECRWAITSS